MKHSPHLAALIEALRTLPGVGPKTAQRMAFHLLQEGRPGARALAQTLAAALESVSRCRRCRMLTEGELCVICAAPQRDAALLCAVESPADVVAIESSGSYRGRYFVLMGHLSPLDGIGPDQLNIARLIARAHDPVKEVLLALNATVEGQTTAHYLTEQLQGRGISVTRLAQGVPMGGELDYLDEGTLAAAIKSRRAV